MATKREKSNAAKKRQEQEAKIKKAKRDQVKAQVAVKMKKK